MGYTSTPAPLTCTSCEGEIGGRAEFHVGLPFCCAGCVAGGPCTCSYDGEIIDIAAAAEAGWEVLVEVVA
ncbi:MAG TPA: hypothetical protein VFV72_04090 [Candidatus Limnocylindrales bacterium]|nr:hypothetical protein [Candidatus Limnocylindrales bacterium]